VHRQNQTTPTIRDNPQPMILTRLVVVISLLGLVGCGIFAGSHKDGSAPAAHRTAESPAIELSPAQDYAGEILAYFLQVVVGHIGSEESRRTWRSTGNEAVLDFQVISKIMSKPGFSKRDLMALDFNLLGLVELLSHYNPQFNQFKGRFIFDSVYPSSELIAVRLLIQRKLHHGEKVSFTALQEGEAFLRPNANVPSPADLKAMNLSAVEFQLVKDVFTSDPLFFQYYKHPFIVDALARIGFYQQDRLTAQISRYASYRQYAPRHPQSSARDSVTVAILPSFVQEFEFGGKYERPYVYGFKPSSNYLQAIETLKADILARTAYFLRVELKSNGQAAPANELSWGRLWDQTYAPLVHFQLFDQRPLTIYPGNADRLVKEISPKADLIILLLGEGVDRAIDVNEKTVDFSTTGRLYFNLDDIRYYRRNNKIDEIAKDIVGRLLTIRISADAPAANG